MPPEPASHRGVAPGSADTEDPLVGRVLDNRYRIVKSLAAGGMGRVYLAEQLGLDRRVAVKVLTRQADDDGRFRDRFFREAKLSSKLTHPNTVRVYDYGRTDDDVFYIAMEYLEGRTLGAVLKNEGVLDPLRAIALVLQVCASLAEAHAMGVVHRDLKPDNLFLVRTADGREFLRVLDFGIAKDTNATEVPTQAGTVFGSPAYMSPEQILEQDLSPKSDLYSVGAVLYRSLTLRQPHGESNAITAMARHVLAEVVPFSVARPDLKIPASLEWITRQCLSKDPQERFVSATELASALRACELEIRGLVPKLEPRMERGRMRLPEAQEAEVRRHEAGGAGPAQPPRNDSAVAPAYVPEPSQSLSHTLRHPAVLVLGGMVPLIGLSLGVVVVLVILLFALVVTRPDPTPTPVPVPVATQPVPKPAPPPPPAPVHPPVAPVAAPVPAPAPVAPAPPPRPAPPKPAPTAPKPAPVEPAPAPAPVEPAPVPSPAPGKPKSDLRDPFKRGTE